MLLNGDFMKKAIILVLISALAVSLFSCGKDIKEIDKKHCSSCDEMISESAKFCEFCGYDLSKNKGDKTAQENNDYTFDDYVNDKQSSSITIDSASSNDTQDDYEYKVLCLSSGCDNIPNNHGLYCSEHACAKSGCTMEKSYSSSFCNRHTCDSIGCDNAKIEWRDYCGEHACADDSCSREKNYSGIYCSWHECNEVGCENKKKDSGSYCSEHECANSWCTSSKAPFSDYCYIHDDD